MTLMQYAGKPQNTWELDKVYEQFILANWPVRYCWHTPAPDSTTCYAFTNEYNETHVALVKDGSPTADQWRNAANR